MSQIVLHRSGTDPDFTYRKRLDVDFSHLLGVFMQSYMSWLICFLQTEMVNLLDFAAEVCVDKARAEEFEQRASELAQKASASAPPLFSISFFSLWLP